MGAGEPRDHGFAEAVLHSDRGADLDRVAAGGDELGSEAEGSAGQGELDLPHSTLLLGVEVLEPDDEMGLLAGAADALDSHEIRDVGLRVGPVFDGDGEFSGHDGRLIRLRAVGHVSAVRTLDSE